jgi:hypothetical protein
MKTWTTPEKFYTALDSSPFNRPAKHIDCHVGNESPVIISHSIIANSNENTNPLKRSIATISYDTIALDVLKQIATRI